MIRYPNPFAFSFDFVSLVSFQPRCVTYKKLSSTFSHRCIIKMHECKYCDYKTNRKDNFDRHETSVHSNEKVVCNCGVVVSPSALDRHKKNSCMLKLRSSVKICAQQEGTTFAKLQTTVQLNTHEDGTVEIRHGVIKINGVSFVLVPADAVIAPNNNQENEEEQSHDAVDTQSNDEGLGNSMEFSPCAFETTGENLFDDLIPFGAENI